LYPGEEASLWVADLGQASKVGFVVDGVIPHPLVSKPILCQTPTDGGVTIDASHRRAGHP
jgi:hypothetical protein